jgi:hypothetical protein
MSKRRLASFAHDIATEKNDDQKQKSRIAMSQIDVMVTRLLFLAGREHLFHFDALRQNRKGEIKRLEGLLLKCQNFRALKVP